MALPKVGSVYDVEHPTRGRFRAKVLSVFSPGGGSTWVDLYTHVPFTVLLEGTTFTEATDAAPVVERRRKAGAL